MKFSVANPIYDSVFKFLMEDERIAKTVLSALLKKEVVSVEMRRHEHPNITRDNISMFRIDFAARVMQDDGSTRLILIELQKTWLSTETLRFRRYLAAQYNAEENMLKDSNSEAGPYAIPMIAIYLLGHRIGDIDKAVVYVNHKALDYDGKEIENGENDPFINSLTHDSIIVQIPLLHGKINNKLDRVLSVFDQSQRDDSNQHIVRLDINNYEGDSELMHLVHRLGLAAMNASVRQEMDDEDEFFSAIESRDTQLMQMNKRLSETTSQLNEATSQLNEATSQLNETTAQLKAVVEVMLQNGMSVETIANTINKSADDVKDLLKS
jgi:methyl-accepting chemotaxis protein